MDWMLLFKEIGILAGLVVFFTFTSWKREERMASRVTALEQYVETSLISALQKATEALSKNSDILITNGRILEALIARLNERPCMLNDPQCVLMDILTTMENRILDHLRAKGDH